MYRRHFEKTLEDWKNTPNHKPLVVKGCRQCGKTSSVLKFAKENYESVIYINFFESPEYVSIFSGSLKIDDLMVSISAALSAPVSFIPGKTVIVLDEIQECPQARTSLKFFFLDGRFDLICTGSLLGVQGYCKMPASIPVGYETIKNMYPMDFEEFLWANGITDNVIQSVKSHMDTELPVSEALHQRFRNLLLKYVVVGGMPDVVKTFIETKNMQLVLERQREIVSEYREDMIKYAEQKDKAKITQCFDSIPKQLAKENKKFQYALLGKGSTASKYAGSIQWIEAAGIICRCYNLSITELPLDGNAIEDIFKIYMCDTGLFVSMLEEGTQKDILEGNLFCYKGAIFENLVADFFSKMGRKLYYFHKDSGLEVDFVMRYKNECVLLEVKATNGNTKSTKTILNHPEKYHVGKAIKLIDGNLGRSGSILTLPLYMGCWLKDI